MKTPARPSDGVLDALTYLAAQSYGRVTSAHDVGSFLSSTAPARGARGVGQRGSRYTSPGMLANAPLNAAKRRGWTRRAVLLDAADRLDLGWVITDEGRSALATYRPKEQDQ